MQKAYESTPVRSPARGRMLMWLGLAFLFVGPGIYVAQVALHQLVVPWYAPVLATGGVLLALGALLMRFTIVRTGVLLVVGLLCALQWLFLLVAVRMPEYTGPVKPGEKIQAFVAQRPDKSEFTEKDLEGQATVLVLYRGRW